MYPVRELEAEESRRQTAIPVNPDEQRENRRKDRRRWAIIVGAAIVVVSAVLGVVLGVVLRPSSGNPIDFAPSMAPTTQVFADLEDLIVSASLDDGEALADPLSPQSMALTWLADNSNLDEYPDWRKVQRHTLATFYYSTNGDGWIERNDWLTDKDECEWFTSAVDPTCDEDGVFTRLVLFDNNVSGILPKDLALFSDQMRKSLDYIAASVLSCMYTCASHEM